MIDYKIVAVTLVIAASKLGRVLPFDVALYIAFRLNKNRVLTGRSSYARRRRAKSIGRCHRCFRVSPKFYFTTRCDGKTCVPSFNYNVWACEFIKYGLAGPKDQDT
ncbi:MAG: nucleic acid binding protein [Hainan betaflexivirus]|nr:MAG: nucleic acid binding protein [Hainan betaflexivirus]